jgi:hypothetical protein
MDFEKGNDFIADAVEIAVPYRQVTELDELQLALVGGGIGEVVAG